MNSRKKLVWAFSTSFMVMALFAIMVPIAHAGDVTEEWVARYNGPGNSYDRARAMATDSAGNVYVTGDSVGSGTSHDYATVAYDSFGNQLWVARYNGPGNWGDYAYAIATDSAGNVYVTGGSSGSGTSHDYATVAYDSSGNQLWVARYNGPNGADEATAIATDSAGNVYVTGRSRGSGGQYVYDYATVAYDSLGNQLWVARYNGPGNEDDKATAIATDSAGNVYVTGHSYSDWWSDADYATIAYDSSGNQLWVARYNGPGNDDDKATAIATDSAGNVYVTGGSSDSRNSWDYATVAYDSLGNQLWVARHNGYAQALATDSAGNVYVTGWSSEDSVDYATIAYDSFGNQLWVARYNGPGNYAYDIASAIATDSAGNVYVTGYGYNGSGGQYVYGYATVAYDSFGNQLWVARYNGSENMFDALLGAIATDSAGNVYVMGSSGRRTSSDYATIKYSQGVQNNPPLAEAGVNQTVECGGDFGAVFTLDGSGSTDPDGDALTYMWSGPFGTKTGKITTVTLPLGTHTITLTVDDGMGGTATDNVEIVVEDTMPPVVTKAILSGTELQPGLYLSDVLFEMEATDTCSGVAHVSYVLDGTQTIVSGSYASATISSGGDHTIGYEALDNAGNVSAGGSLAFSLFEANVAGISGLIDYFLSQDLIDSQMETSLKKQAATGDYRAFINHIEAQSGKKVDLAAAQILIEAAEFIMAN